MPSLSDRLNPIRPLAGVSVVIPCNREPSLVDTIRNVLLQDNEPGSDALEIIAVGQADWASLPLDRRVRQLDTGELLWSAAARNRGLAAATKSLIVFLDADCRPLPEWLPGIRASQVGSGTVCSGAVVPPVDNQLQASYNLAGFREMLDGLPRATRRSLASFCLWGPRRAFVDVGGFDETWQTAEDLDITIRLAQAGWVLMFEPTVRVLHQPRVSSLRELLWRGWAHGGRSIQVRRHYLAALGLHPWTTSPVLLGALSPFVAAFFLGRTFQDNPRWRGAVLRCASAIYLYRIAWCLGAARSGVTPNRSQVRAVRP